MSFLSRHRVQSIVALCLAVVALVSLSFCLEQKETLGSVVEDLADQAGTDVVSVLEVQREDDRRLDVSVTFVRQDGGGVQLHRSAVHDQIQSTDRPFPAAPATGQRFEQLDLEGLERRLGELEDCTDRRGRLFVYNGHVGETIQCGTEGVLIGRIDDKGVAPLPLGDASAAAAVLKTDLDMLQATAVSDLSIVLGEDETHVEMQLAAPTQVDTSGRPCAPHLIHASGAVTVDCVKAGPEKIACERLRPEVIERLWDHEGAPRSGLRIRLDLTAGPRWHTTQGTTDRYYSLDGRPL